jgi:hypothetical protein
MNGSLTTKGSLCQNYQKIPSGAREHQGEVEIEVGV